MYIMYQIANKQNNGKNVSNVKMRCVIHLSVVHTAINKNKYKSLLSKIS
jgi:hypothetical protein